MESRRVCSKSPQANSPSPRDAKLRIFIKDHLYTHFSPARWIYLSRHCDEPISDEDGDIVRFNFNSVFQPFRKSKGQEQMSIKSTISQTLRSFCGDLTVNLSLPWHDSCAVQDEKNQNLMVNIRKYDVEWNTSLFPPDWCQDTLFSLMCFLKIHFTPLTFCLKKKWYRREVKTYSKRRKKHEQRFVSETSK